MSVSQVNSSLETYCLTSIWVAAWTVTGAIAADLFNVINPIGGALFAATSIITSRSIEWIYEKMQIDSNTTIAKIALFLKSTFIASVVTTAAGFPITFPMGIVFSLSIVGTSTAIIIISKIIASILGNSSDGYESLYIRPVR